MNSIHAAPKCVRTSIRPCSSLFVRRRSPRLGSRSHGRGRHEYQLAAGCLGGRAGRPVGPGRAHRSGVERGRSDALRSNGGAGRKPAGFCCCPGTDHPQCARSPPRSFLRLFPRRTPRRHHVCCPRWQLELACDVVRRRPHRGRQREHRERLHGDDRHRGDSAQPHRLQRRRPPVRGNDRQDTRGRCLRHGRCRRDLPVRGNGCPDRSCAVRGKPHERRHDGLQHQLRHGRGRHRVHRCCEHEHGQLRLARPPADERRDPEQRHERRVHARLLPRRDDHRAGRQHGGLPDDRERHLPDRRLGNVLEPGLRTPRLHDPCNGRLLAVQPERHHRRAERFANEQRHPRALRPAP